MGIFSADSFSHYSAHIPVITVKLHLLGPPAFAISLFTSQRVKINIRPYILGFKELYICLCGGLILINNGWWIYAALYLLV